MLNRIRFALQGSALLLIISVSTIVLSLVMFALAIARRLMPAGNVRNTVTRWLAILGDCWVSLNCALLRRYRGMHWDIDLPEGLDRRGCYLVFCNHRSWVDILVLQYCLNRRAPFMRFMLKRQLIWVPFLGIAWWALDMPFLRRYTPRELMRNPSLRGKDLDIAARACEKLKHVPVSMMSFPEGTRFSAAKHEQQNSPYRHLLTPRYGGVGEVLYSFGEALQAVIDVTIYYPDGTPSFWQFISGQVRNIEFFGVLRRIDDDLRGVNFREEPVAKRRLKMWLDGIWKEKDRLLDEKMTANRRDPGPQGTRQPVQG